MACEEEWLHKTMMSNLKSRQKTGITHIYCGTASSKSNFKMEMKMSHYWWRSSIKMTPKAGKSFSTGLPQVNVFSIIFVFFYSIKNIKYLKKDIIFKCA